MNDNPVGTPNPLNPAPATPAAPVKPAVPAAPVEPAVPATEPVATEVSGTSAPKKKTGLIAGLIAGILVLGGAIAAVLIIFVFNGSADAVPAAVSKVLSGEVKNFAINGTINYDGSGNPLISSLSVGLDAKINTSTFENEVIANVNANVSGLDLNFTFNERKASDGDMYVKIDGLTDSVNSILFSQSGVDCDEVDCEALMSQMMSDSQSSQLDLINSIEGEWLHTNLSDFSGVGSNITDNTTQCLVNVLSSASNYSKDIADIYKQNSFVTYSTDNIPITKKKDTIYKLGMDYDKMADFLNAMKTSALANDLLACTGGNAINSDISASDVKQIFSNFPAVYAEVDGNNNFTRLYFEISGLTADLSVSYPGTISVEAPSSYHEMSEYLTDLIQSLGGFSSYNAINTYDIYDYGDDDWYTITDEWDLGS